MVIKSIPDIEQCITQFISEELSIPYDEVDRDANFGSFGLSSRAATTLMGILEDKLRVELSPVLAFENETIGKLASAVGEQAGL